MSPPATRIGLDDSLLGGFTEEERARIRAGENFALWGWKDIARAIEKSQRTTIDRANRDAHPLPVEWEDDRVFARAWNLIAWRQDQRRAHRYHRELARLGSPLVSDSHPPTPTRAA